MPASVQSFWPKQDSVRGVDEEEDGEVMGLAGPVNKLAAI
jgi:hypothetical protein